jgi:hypothetical protein
MKIQMTVKGDLISWTADIAVHLETTRDNIRRSQILARIPTDLPTEDSSAAFFYHPVCTTCSTGTITVESAPIPDTPLPETIVLDVREITLAQFMTLPGQLFQAWAEAVVTLNPHLLATPEVADEKKQ